MINIDEFFPRLLPQVPGCSDPLARQSLLDAAIEFCEKSLVVRQDLDMFFSVAGRKNYDLDPPTNQHAIVRVLSVNYNGSRLHGIFQEDVPNLLTTQAMPHAFYTTRVDNEFLLNLYPTPDERESIVVNTALKPTRNAVQVDDDLYNYWADAIVDGAISRIARIPNQPFSDVNYAAAMQASFADKTARARMEAYQGRVRGGTRVQMRPFV